MAVETVWLLNSNNTLVNNDTDFTRFETYLTAESGGVLFTDFDTKAEFALTGTTSPSIAQGSAIVVCNRLTSTPVANQKLALRFTLGSAKSFTWAVNGSKIYIEVNKSLIDDPMLISDVFPSTDYALGLNIGSVAMSTSYPASNFYIPLWSYDGTTWTDDRQAPLVHGRRLDLSDLTSDVTTTGVITWSRMKSSYSATANDDMINKAYLDAVLVWIWESIPQSTNSSYGTSRIATDAIARAWTNETDTINAKQLIEEVTLRPWVIIAGTTYTASSIWTTAISSITNTRLFGGNILRTWTYRISFSLNAWASSTWFASIWVNWSQVWPEYSAAWTTTNVSVDLSILAWQSLEIYWRWSTWSLSVSVQNYLVRYNMWFWTYTFTTS